MYFTIYVSAGIWGIVLVSLLLLAAHGGMYAYDSWYKKKKFSHNNEVAGIVFSVLSLIYSLIVAFVIVAVWQNYEDLNRTIEKETDGLNNVLMHSSILPDSLRIPVEDAVKNYCLKVVNEEWNMNESQQRYKGKIIPSLRMMLFRAKAENRIHESLLSLLDDNLSNISNLHRERLSHTSAHVPDLIWMILVIGSLMVICFSFFLRMEPLQLRRIFLSFLWGMIGMSLFLIYMLDHPFIGSTQVSRAPYEAILSQVSND